MQDEAKLAVGLDIGTNSVKVAIGWFGDGKKTIVGVGEAPTQGMRKGTIIDLDRVAASVDAALLAAEKMSGQEAHGLTVNINGSHIHGLNSTGVIAVGSGNRTIANEDLVRVEDDAANVARIPQNYEIIDISPRIYALDGQRNIQDPVGMTGVRLEVDAYITTALAPHLRNIDRVLEMNQIPSKAIVVSGVAAGQAVITEQQREHGVVLIDIGAGTTNMAVYEEGNLLHVAVLPVGSNNITNDLAIVLKTDLSIADKIKREYAVAAADQRSVSGSIRIKSDGKTLSFDSGLVDEIVEARLEALFELVNHELKQINRLAKLPGGVVLTGGGAKLKGIAECAKKYVNLNARVLKPTGFVGMNDKIEDPVYATVVGLMLIDHAGMAQKLDNKAKKRGLFGGIFGKK
jgi:cell division protein FtsA